MVTKSVALSIYWHRNCNQQYRYMNHAKRSKKFNGSLSNPIHLNQGYKTHSLRVQHGSMNGYGFNFYHVICMRIHNAWNLYARALLSLAKKKTRKREIRYNRNTKSCSVFPNNFMDKIYIRSLFIIRFSILNVAIRSALIKSCMQNYFLASCYFVHGTCDCIEKCLR